MDKTLEKAARYVANNIDIEDARHALHRSWIEGCPVCRVDSKVCDEMCDLLEEYGEDKGFPEGWWLEYGDLDDVCGEILDIILEND